MATINGSLLVHFGKIADIYFLLTDTDKFFVTNHFLQTVRKICEVLLEKIRAKTL